MVDSTATKLRILLLFSAMMCSWFGLGLPAIHALNNMPLEYYSTLPVSSAEDHDGDGIPTHIDRFPLGRVLERQKQLLRVSAVTAPVANVLQ